MVDRPAAALFLTAVATLTATVSARPQTQTLAITRVNVVDVVDGRVLPNSTVSISGRTIATVTPGGAPPAGARVVDGQETFLIPGLWDMHAHMEASGESALQLSVANGVTGIRDMGSDVDLILKMRDGPVPPWFTPAGWELKFGVGELKELGVAELASVSEPTPCRRDPCRSRSGW